MKKIVIASIAAVNLSGCAYSSVQDMSRSTFQVSTTAAPICGKSGAAKVASKLAAIEVIKRGGDRFLLATSDNSKSFGGFMVGVPISRNTRGVVVKMLEPTDPDYNDGFSAREILGDDWEKQVKRGKPATC